MFVFLFVVVFVGVGWGITASLRRHQTTKKRKPVCKISKDLTEFRCKLLSRLTVTQRLLEGNGFRMTKAFA